MANRRKVRLERDIEESCRKIALKKGWVSRKMNGMGFNHWPDRLFIPPASASHKLFKKGVKLRPFWVEFKRPGEEPTEMQQRMIDDLQMRGEEVHVCDNEEDFGNILYDAEHP